MIVLLLFHIKKLPSVTLTAKSTYKWMLHKNEHQQVVVQLHFFGIEQKNLHPY